MTDSIPALTTLNFLPYIDESGFIPTEVQGKVGIYAIFDADHVLQFIGYSRDVYLSLQQHLVRCPIDCYWFKVQTIDRPNRTILEATRDAWIAENGLLPPGNGPAQAQWTQPIDVRSTMRDEEQIRFAALDEFAQGKLLKQVARRVEEQILATLQARGVKMPLRFNPKLKESGLLDLNPS
ncbi:MAG: GIY-YIG nuclease family protein [Leptolyngbyaceae cyanobacterium bins.59]|nr:GIY-YIG nuclease family protein [Leptolyngbyaceae cyanobacterium bins.59]